MAIYGNPADLRCEPSSAFTDLWEAGDRPDRAGVYRCGCGAEWPLRDDEALPDHEHAKSQGDVTWRLIIAVEASRVVGLPPRAKLRTMAAQRARAV